MLVFMVRARLARVAVVAAVAACAFGCAGVASLDDQGPALSDDERRAVRGQVDAALDAKSYKAAWAQEVAAGADRGRLAEIAVAALEHRSGNAGDMFAAMHAKWGALEPGPRARVSALVEAARRAGDWERALELEILAADDAPAYARAWAVYEAAPHDRAPALLDSVLEARKEHAERAESED
jgi:hypothetical protein